MNTREMATMGPVSQMPVPVVSESMAVIAMIERASRDPAVDIDKMNSLWEMLRQMQAEEAEANFNMAMGDVQSRIKRIIADMDNVQTKSRYASYGQIDEAIRSIYTSAGFSISFNEAVGSAGDGMMRMLAYVSHVAPGARRGFTRTYHIDVPCDGKGARGGDVMSKTHAHISGKTYGKRALVDMIFNLAIGRDDDGNAAPGGTMASDLNGITCNQLLDLRKLIDRKGADEAKVCKACRVKRLEDLTVRLFQQAWSKLEAMQDVGR